MLTVTRASSAHDGRERTFCGFSLYNSCWLSPSAGTGTGRARPRPTNCCPDGIASFIQFYKTRARMSAARMRGRSLAVMSRADLRGMSSSVFLSRPEQSAGRMPFVKTENHACAPYLPGSDFVRAFL